jgi:hypothetical protein
MIPNKLGILSIVLLSMLAPLQSRADEAHLITSEGELSPEYRASEREFDAARDAFYQGCQESSEDCDWEALDALYEYWIPKLDEVRLQYPSKATVSVRRRGEPIILVLSAVHPLSWRIKAKAGVEIKEIILSGYPHQTVKLDPRLRGTPVKDRTDSPRIGAFLDDRVKPVTMASLDDNGELSCPADLSQDPVAGSYNSELEDSITALHAIGLELASAQADRWGEVGYGDKARFVIGRKAEGIKLVTNPGSLMCYAAPDGSLVLGSTLRGE